MSTSSEDELIKYSFELFDLLPESVRVALANAGTVGGDFNLTLMVYKAFLLGATEENLIRMIEDADAYVAAQFRLHEPSANDPSPTEKS